MQTPHYTTDTRYSFLHAVFYTQIADPLAVSWLWTIMIWSVSFIVHWCRTYILTFPNSIIGKNRYDQGVILFLQIWCGCDTILVFFVCLRQISIQRESEHWALICSVCTRWKTCQMVSGPVVWSGGEGLSYLAGASWRRQAQGAGKQLPAGGRLVATSLLAGGQLDCWSWRCRQLVAPGGWEQSAAVKLQLSSHHWAAMLQAVNQGKK